MPRESKPQETVSSHARLEGDASAEASPTLVHHCHCSMCRRWTGGAFATLAWFRRADIDWDGPVASFRSSPIAVRTHCGRCGSPLSLTYDARDDMALNVGTFDQPERVTPSHHYGVESRLSWADIGAQLLGRRTREQW